MFRPVRKRHLASAAMLAGLLSAPPAAQALSYPPLFGTNEARSNNIAMFPKWRGTLDRYFEEARLPQDCLPGLMTQCLLQDWQTFLAGQQGQDPLAQLSAVNAEMNRRRYVLDPTELGHTRLLGDPAAVHGKERGLRGLRDRQVHVAPRTRLVE